MQNELALISLGCSWSFDIIYQNLKMCDFQWLFNGFMTSQFCANSESLCTTAIGFRHWVPSCLLCLSHFHAPSTPLKAMWFHHLGSINYVPQKCWMHCPSLCHAARWPGICLVSDSYPELGRNTAPQGMSWSILLDNKGSRWYNLEVWENSLPWGQTLTNRKQEIGGSLAHKFSLRLPFCELFGVTIYPHSLYTCIHR